MAHTRRLPIQSFSATTAFVGSQAGGVAIVATSTTRANLQIQPLTDGLRVSPVGSVTASSMLIASQQIYTAPDGFQGPLFANPNAGATAPVAIWDSSY
jgi:hypothetical protein